MSRNFIYKKHLKLFAPFFFSFFKCRKPEFRLVLHTITGAAAEKAAARLQILPRIFVGSHSSCLSNSAARLPIKSSHSLRKKAAAR